MKFLATVLRYGASPGVWGGGRWGLGCHPHSARQEWQWRRLYKARGHVPPHFYKWFTREGTVSIRTANNPVNQIRRADVGYT